MPLSPEQRSALARHRSVRAARRAITAVYGALLRPVTLLWRGLLRLSERTATLAPASHGSTGRSTSVPTPAQFAASHSRSTPTRPCAATAPTG